MVKEWGCILFYVPSLYIKPICIKAIEGLKEAALQLLNELFDQAMLE